LIRTTFRKHVDRVRLVCHRRPPDDHHRARSRILARTACSRGDADQVLVAKQVRDHRGEHHAQVGVAKYGAAPVRLDSRPPIGAGTSD
jgi:hypothetical protein